jgi:predicted O-methyltransferase YrrM
MPSKNVADAEKYLAERKTQVRTSEVAWAEVDDYVTAHLLADADRVFTEILGANAKGGLPSIDVSPTQGKFLNLLVSMTGARRILEIGTLGGYSTTWMAKALPAAGRITTLEYSPKHAEVARANFARAGVADRIEVLVGPALETLPTLTGPFDLVFIDADKPNNSNYLDWALKLGRPGTVIILDNVVRGGGVVREGSGYVNIEGARGAFELLKSHPRIESTALQTVGSKGWDGFILARVK